MKFLIYIVSIVAIGIFGFCGEIFAQVPTAELNTSPLSTKNQSEELQSFIGNTSIKWFFVSSEFSNSDSVYIAFFNIAQAIKNVFLILAVIFLIYGVIKLFYSEASDDDISKWKKNIVWTTGGIIFMQIAFNIWKTGLQFSEQAKSPLTAEFGWKLWQNLVEPFILLFQYFAGFAFLAMMIYAFYVIITGAGEEEKLTKGKNTLIFAVIGFVLVQIPHKIVALMYSGLPACEEWAKNSNLWTMAASPCHGSNGADFSGAVGLIGTIIQYVNSFLTLFCVLAAIYAGWILFTSRGEEEQVTKAKKIILYIVIGLILLVISHAVFRFFVMREII